MPLLVSLDEYNSAIEKIYAQANTAISSNDLEYLKAALKLISYECEKVTETVSHALAHKNN